MNQDIRSSFIAFRYPRVGRTSLWCTLAVILVLAMPVSLTAQEGFSWKSWAELGGGTEGSLAGSIAAGIEMPLGGRRSARAWGSCRFVPGFTDISGEPLSGFDLGLSVRATWHTTLR